MKNLFKVIVLIFILCQLLCCFSACQKSTLPNETYDNNVTISEEESSDLAVDSEKTYSYVKEAWDNSAAYTGAYTMKYSAKYVEDSDTDIETIKISVDPQRNLYFSDEIDGSYTSHEKILPTVFDSYHYYDGKNFYFMTDPQADYQIFEKYKFQDVYLEGEMCDVIPNLSFADTLSELRAAYSEVIADACNSPESNVLKASAEITASAEKEIYSLSIQMSIENKDGTKDSWKIEMLAQNYKLVKINFLGEIEKYNEKIEEQIEYIYEFDQSGYDAIDVQPPNVTTRYDIAKSINFYFKNSTLPVTESTSVWDQKNTIEAAYAEILNSGSFDLDNYTWYTDPQLTKPFDPTSISDEEWFDLENLYTEEYTENRVSIKYKLRHDVNEAYSIVMGKYPWGRSGSMGATVGNKFYYSNILSNEYENNDMEIYLNGVKQTKGSTYFEIDGSQAIYQVELINKSSWLGW